MRYIKGFPDDLIELTYSNHAKERLIERTTGSLILAPQFIRLTQNNTKEVVKRKGRVVKATVFINYKKGTKMCLPTLIPSGIVKTVYFEKDAIKKRNNMLKEYPLTPKEVFPKEDKQTEEYRTEVTEIGRLREDASNVSGDMGREKNKWEELFGIIGGIFRG